ncbi:MAG: hypothetical protein PHP74_00345 [Candidatus Gracilibacteria bacterium]|nr:hypothetical protein [Candidatus Gracilibacteria bacterium]
MHKQKQKNWIKRIVILIMISLALVVTGPQIVNYTVAENEQTAYAESGAQTEKVMERIQGLTELQTFFHKLLWPVLYMIGGFLDNSLLFGGGMGEQMRNIWVPIRNIVNIFFVIALVGIALYNILGIGEDGGNTAIKTALPKIIVGIIAVNFSFLGIKVALDAVNIITTAIFALPNEVGQSQIFDETADSKKIQESICFSLAEVKPEEGGKMSDNKLNDRARTAAYKRIAQKYGVDLKDQTANVENFNGIVDAGNKYIDDEKAKEQFKKDIKDYKPICAGKGLSADGTAYFDKFKSSNAAMAMATNMGNMTFIPTVSLASIKSVDGLGQIAVNVLFGLVMYILFAASFVALLIVLMARLVVMWLSIVMSPLLIVAMAIPALKENLGAIGKISEQFVKHLIAPIPIAMSLSIGWIMLKVLKEQQLSNILAEGTDLTLGIPVVGMSTLQELIVAIGCAAVVWLGVFTSAEGTVAAGMTNWIKDKLAVGGKFLATAPFKYLPIIPIGKERYTLGAMTHAIDELSRKANTPDDSFVKKYPGIFSNIATAGEDLKNATSAEDAVGILKGLAPGLQKGDEKIAEGLKGMNKKMKNELFDKYKNLAPLLKKYENAKDDAERKAAGEAIVKELQAGTYSGIDAKTKKNAGTDSDSTATGAGDTAAKADSKKKKDASKPAKQTIADFEKIEVNPPVADKQYVVAADGTVGTWDEAGKTFTALNVKELEGFEKANSANMNEARVKMEAKVAADTNGFTKETVTTPKQKGELFIDTNGTITLIDGRTAYEVDAATGRTKKLSAVPADKGAKVGEVKEGKPSYSPADPPLTSATAKAAMDTIKKTVPPPST